VTTRTQHFSTGIRSFAWIRYTIEGASPTRAAIAGGESSLESCCHSGCDFASLCLRSGRLVGELFPTCASVCAIWRTCRNELYRPSRIAGIPEVRGLALLRGQSLGYMKLGLCAAVPAAPNRA
jgi:hypothetical protein